VNSPLQAKLIRGPVAPHLRDMALPMVWGLLATMSFNAVDTYFVSQIGITFLDNVSNPGMGDRALAAMSYTFPVVLIVTSISIGLGAGASSAIARAIGGGNDQAVKRLATDSMTLATIISVMVSIVGLLTIDWVFVSLLGASPELLPLIHDYMFIWYFSAPLLMIPMISLSSLRALGFAKIQGSLMIVAAILNGVLDPLLIFGWGGFPRLEMQGAAYATLISRFVTLIVAVYVLQGRMQMLTNPFVSWHKVKKSWLSLSHVGLPSMLSNLVIPISSALVIKLVSGHGDLAVAGFGIAIRIEPISLIVFYALSGVVGPFFGQNKGANKIDRLFEALSIVAKFCAVFGVVVAIVFWFAGTYIAALFSQSPEVLSVAVTYLAIVPVSYGLYGLVMSVNAMFNGLGLPFPGLVISFFRVIAIYLPLALFGNWFWGLTGLFVATAFSNLIVGCIAYVWLKNVLSKEKNLLNKKTIVD